MANAEQLLHEAQYAFQSISFGQSRDNARNRSRAKSLCRKIIRKYPSTMEASEAHAILRRLGEEAYSSAMKTQHVHTSQADHHKALVPQPLMTDEPVPQPRFRSTESVGAEAFDWGGLVSWLLMLPKLAIGLVVFAGIVLFDIFGPFIFFPLLVLVLLTGPFRQILKPEQRKEMNEFIVRVNAYIEEQRRSGGGFT